MQNRTWKHQVDKDVFTIYRLPFFVLCAFDVLGTQHLMQFSGFELPKRTKLH
jgi:hypothetical protein